MMPVGSSLLRSCSTPPTQARSRHARPANPPRPGCKGWSPIRHPGVRRARRRWRRRHRRVDARTNPTVPSPPHQNGCRCPPGWASSPLPAQR
jgi:hypothetical protein